MGWRDPFAGAVVDHPGVELPDQGPWLLSDSDLKWPLNLIIDLVNHKTPAYLYLWNSLSSETKTALEEERTKMRVPGVYYEVKPAVPLLTAELNRIIQGKLFYDEDGFAAIKPYLSGDTQKLLDQSAETNLTRLNRLLLEDAFPLDIQRRPKILFDPSATNYVLIDFVAKAISVYAPDGKKNLTADLAPILKDLSRRMTSYREQVTPAGGFNVGIWDVAPKPGELLVHVLGRSIYSISLTTGEITALPHF